MDKLRMKSGDAADGNVAKIAALFPQCVTEHIGKDGKPELAIDFDKLKDELSKDLLDTGEERYQFTWPDKRAASRLANEPIDKTLRPCREESVDFDTTQNLYIEGDNLDVLKLLRENYLGAIKMIYIDPPYNTGSDFVYNDDFAQSLDEYEETSGVYDEDGNLVVDPMQRNTESNGRFHTDWLNMIYPRLKVARDLLAEDGVIFISIDENEYENLKKICDEIFGEQNFFTTFTWINSVQETVEDDTKFAGANLGKIKKSYELILMYAKSKYSMALETPSSPHIIKLITNGGNNISRISIPKGLPATVKEAVIKGHVGGKNDFFEIITAEGMIIKENVLQNDVIIEGPLRNPNMLTRFFNGETVIDHKGQQLIEVFIANNGMIHTKKLKAGDTPSNVLVGKSTTKNGTLLLKNMFGDKLFDFAKPVELVKYLVDRVNGDEFVVLDFFCGSATTAHAVLQLNAEDGRHRKFIMVQLPELTEKDSAAYKAGYANICEIGKERIRRAGRKIKDEAGLQGQDLDIGFRVLRLDSSNMEDVFYRPEDFDVNNIFTSVDNVKADRTPLDLLFQVMPELDIQLSAKIEEKDVNGKKVFFVDDTYLIATFDTEVNESTITEIAKMQPQYFVMRDASAANDNVLDNFEQIFRHYSPDTIRKVM